MVELNWYNFRAKFSGKENSSFEELSYHLFCSEHNNDIGIFGFFNQTGIETEPISLDGKEIGFQAKFYETTLSSNKSDIIDSIKKAKRENSDLSKIYFYLNKSFSESTKKGKKDPQYKIDIEAAAKKQKLKIEWRVPSHFERQLKLPKNEYLLDYYFSTGVTTLNLIDSLIKHTENVLYPIQSGIKFGETLIKIDRSNIINDLESKVNESNVIIVSGDGGSGKTALLKDYYKESVNRKPFYFFKAIEFEISDVQQVFKKYGNFTLNDFIDAHQKEREKIIVIDSAERISDIQNQEPIKEFIASAIKNEWTIIFTTRNSYLNDLRFQFIEIFKLPFESVSLKNISAKEIEILSQEFNFDLPINERLIALIQNLFYLSEFLSNYDSFDNSVGYQKFKELLWLKKIQNSAFKKDNIHIDRENCFLEIIRLRSTKGGFFVYPKECSSNVLRLLEKDEIIGFDKSAGGYFITHDIYEEWGLNLIIHRSFLQFPNHNEFLSFIGSSLITRRTFRHWISNMLMEEIQKVKPLIENIIADDNVEKFWEDEVIVSILLSDYSKEFFDLFENRIIENDFSLLKRIIFLLRIACKEVDDEFYKLLGNDSEIGLNYIFTKPKGKGWESVIEFLYKYKSSFKLLENTIIFPVLKDWNGNKKRGEITRMSSLMVLEALVETQTNKGLRYTNNLDKDCFKVLAEGSLEIKEELGELFTEIENNNWVWPSNPFFDFCTYILNMRNEGLALIFAHSEHILKLADIYWFRKPPKGSFPSYGIGTEQYFGLTDGLRSDYSPASAYQTPFYWMLKYKFGITVDYILQMTNKCVKHYFESGFDPTVEEVEIKFADGVKNKQIISNALWQLYRGTGSPVTPYLLQSIHMALEKVLLELAKEKDSKMVEDWLIYILKNSISASITAVVTSIILANQDKFFNVEKILFRTLEFLQYDNSRMISEYHAKSLYSIGFGMNYLNKIYQEERIKSCDDPHRMECLESQIFRYQYFANSGVSEEFAEQRKNEIFQIIDEHKSSLPISENETDKDKTTRILLTRIDRRKMSHKIEEKEDKVLISFEPDLDPELKKLSEEAVKESQSVMKYSGLRMWSTFKLEGDKKHQTYEEYQNDYKKVINETKEVIALLKNNDTQFHLLNGSIPSLSCSVLIRFYSDELTKDEKIFCKDIILEYATAPFQDGYNYQVSDGVEESISSIPYLLTLFPDEVQDLNFVLFLILMDNRPMDNSNRISNFSIKAFTEHLWNTSPTNALKILLCFLKFKPLFNSIKDEKSKRVDMPYSRIRVSYQEVAQEFLKQYEKELEAAFGGDFEVEQFNVDNYSLEDLNLIFQIIPVKTENETLLNYASEITSFLSEKLLKNNRHRDRDPNRDRSQDVDYSFRHKVLTKYSYLVLYRPLSDIKRFTKPFVDNFQSSEEMAFFFEQFIWAEDKINQYDQFWVVWEQFYKKIIELGRSGKGHYSDSIIRTYLLAWNNWRDTAKDWRSLKDREKLFYQRIIDDIGESESVFASIVKVLNSIGSNFLDEGIDWLSTLIEKKGHPKVEGNTIYYAELFVRKYCYLNREKIRREVELKNKMITILNLLVENGSVNGYLLREDIL